MIKKVISEVVIYCASKTRKISEVNSVCDVTDYVVIRSTSSPLAHYIGNISRVPRLIFVKIVGASFK